MNLYYDYIEHTNIFRRVLRLDIDSVIDHNISILKYNPLAGSSYTRLPKELNHQRKGLINSQNIYDNEWFKWCLVRYLNPADRNPARITKAGKDFAKKVDFKGTKFPVKVKDIYKVEKKNSISISVFGYENKEKHPNYISKKCCAVKYVDLLLIEGKGKRHNITIKKFYRYMYNHTFIMKIFCRYCFQAFSTKEMPY